MSPWLSKTQKITEKLRPTLKEDGGKVRNFVNSVLLPATSAHLEPAILKILYHQHCPPDYHVPQEQLGT